MIFIAKADGTIESIVTTPIYQSSNYASRIILLAPLPSNASVTVAFRLPNGIKTTERLTTPNMTNYALKGELLGKDNNGDYVDYACWVYLLPYSVTEYAGKVDCQFFAYTAKQLLTTYATELTINKGVAPVLPESPEPDIYTQILEAIANINAEIANIYPVITVNALPIGQEIKSGFIYYLAKKEDFNDREVGFYTYIENKWIRIDNNVKISNQPSIIYGTDESGKQTLIPRSELAKTEELNAVRKGVEKALADNVVQNKELEALKTGKQDNLSGSENIVIENNVVKIKNVATLGTDGKVLPEQLPSFVDDVVEGTLTNDTTFTATDGTIYNASSPDIKGKIYLDIKTNITYRWADTQFVAISVSGDDYVAKNTTPSILYATDELGNQVVLPQSDFKKDEIPVATADKVGGFKAEPKTDKDTQPIKIGADGKAYAEIHKTTLKLSTEKVPNAPVVRSIQANGTDNWNVASGDDITFSTEPQSGADNLQSVIVGQNVWNVGNAQDMTFSTEPYGNAKDLKGINVGGSLWNIPSGGGGGGGCEIVQVKLFDVNAPNFIFNIAKTGDILYSRRSESSPSSAMEIEPAALVCFEDTSIKAIDFLINKSIVENATMNKDPNTIEFDNTFFNCALIYNKTEGVVENASEIYYFQFSYNAMDNTVTSTEENRTTNYFDDNNYYFLIHQK